MMHISDGEHTVQYTNDVLQNCTPKTYIILLTNVTPINSIQILKNLIDPDSSTVMTRGERGVGEKKRVKRG